MVNRITATSSVLVAAGVAIVGGGAISPAGAAETAAPTTTTATTYCVVVHDSTAGTAKQSCSLTFDKALRDAGASNIPDGFTYDQFTAQTRARMSGTAVAAATASTLYWLGTGYETTVGAGGGMTYVAADTNNTACTAGFNYGLAPGFGDNDFDSFQNGLCNQAKMWDTFANNKCANGLQNSNGGFGVWQDLAAGNRNRTSCVTFGSA